jgi:UDP-3-O-[3-hydroxymyristoyl] glucosamine N-acyltransferase
MTFITEHNEKYKDFLPFIPGGDIGEAKLYDVTLYPGAQISSGCSIDHGTIIYPNAVICGDVHIGKNCIINPGAVIGMDGFTTRIEEGKAISMRNVGGVVIGDEVEIGANTCIDRASLKGWNTWIGDRVKIDNLVHIAHNCTIGADTRIAPGVVLGGSTDVGERVWIGIGAITKEHTTIGDEAFICMGSVIIDNVSVGAKYGGHYAMEHKEWKQICHRS